jgi:hypothetical protein
MGKPLMSRIPFAKIVIVLVVVFVISLGLCGVTLVVALGGNGAHSTVSKVLNAIAPVEMDAMLLAGVGLLVTVITWVVVAAFGLGREQDEPQRLIDNKDDEDRKDSR